MGKSDSNKDATGGGFDTSEAVDVVLQPVPEKRETGLPCTVHRHPNRSRRSQQEIAERLSQPQSLQEG